MTIFNQEWMLFLDGLPEGHRQALLDQDAVFFSYEDAMTYMVIHAHPKDVGSSHASFVYQHELASCRKPFSETNREMMDISSFIRNDLPQDGRAEYGSTLTRVQEFNSFELIRLLTGTEEAQYQRYTLKPKEEFPKAHNENVKGLVEWFRDCQEPGLVSEFKIEDTFLDNVITDGSLDKAKHDQYKKDENGNKDRIHAMILIGVYEYDGRYWFVLQNTHEEAFFKVVDAEYFASCDGIVRFVSPNADMSLKDEHKIVDGQYTEAVGCILECAMEAPGEG